MQIRWISLRSVARYRLSGYENRAFADQDFRNDQVTLTEDRAGHSATALYAVHLPGVRRSHVQLRGKDPNNYKVQNQWKFLNWDWLQFER